MSPDAQQPQNTPALPEVPQVVPPQPVSPVSEPVVEQQPAAEPPVAAPVVAPQATPAPAPEPFVQPAAPAPGPFAQPTAVFPQQAPVAGPQMTAPVMPAQPVQKKKLGLLIGLIVGGLVVIGGLVAVLLLFVFPSGKIAESDLVSTTSDSTTYLRPKQWESVTVNSISGYGDKKGKDGKSTAGIFVQESTYIKSGIKSASDTSVETFRKTVVSGISSTDAEGMVKEAGVCDSTKDVTTKQSSVSTSSMIGIMRIDGTCARSDATYKIALYLTLGDDGYLRSVFVMATESLWKQNEAVFNKMLESVAQK